MNFIGADADYGEADVVLFGAPYDSTTSFRPGTRFGPAAMRSESFGIETFSPYQDRDLEDVRVHDAGDLEVPFGAPEPVLNMIEAKATSILADGRMPVLLGGEHLVTLGAVRAVAKRFPGLHIIHFDAHADLREDYLGNPLSHACVLRRCHDILGDGRIFQFGIRSGTREEFAFMAEGHVVTERHTCATLPRLAPGGLRFRELLAAVLDVFARFNVVAFDNVELSPPIDPSGRSTALACKFLREELLAVKRPL